MPEHTCELAVLVQVLDNETCLGCALLFPEFSSLGGSVREAAGAVAAHARQVLAAEAVAFHSRRRGPCPVEVGEVSLTLDRPPRSVAWREPVELRLPVVRWAHGQEAFLAFIPALDIE